MGAHSRPASLRVGSTACSLLGSFPQSSKYSGAACHRLVDRQPALLFSSLPAEQQITSKAAWHTVKVCWDYAAGQLTAVGLLANTVDQAEAQILQATPTCVFLQVCSSDANVLGLLCFPNLDLNGACSRSTRAEQTTSGRSAGQQQPERQSDQALLLSGKWCWF